MIFVFYICECGTWIASLTEPGAIATASKQGRINGSEWKDTAALIG
jgi:hypothetical protein